MKIKNEYVKINTKEKEFVLHNYIYDSYLRLFSKGQFTIDENIYSKKFLGYCYIKFDTPLEDYRNAVKTDFDIILEYENSDINGSSTSVTCIYMYGISNKYKIEIDGTNTPISSLEEYFNKKITAIGFGATYYNDIYACIDTSSYSIYISEGNIFTITRKDNFISEAECVGYDYPLHLMPCYKYETSHYTEYEYPLSVLYSVGFGHQKGIMEEELQINNDFEITEESDTSYSINLNIEANRNKFPLNTLRPSNSKYPIKFYADREILPNTKLYAGSGKYPLASNYKYIMYKFQLYYIDSYQYGEIIRINKFYTMNYPISNLKGMFKIRNKIERN